jgi:hypothetical protein
MARDIYVDSLDETTVFLTRGSARHLQSLFVAGREVIRDGSLPGLDLGALQDELLARSRADCLPTHAQLEMIGRQREAIRRYYAEGAHEG